MTIGRLFILALLLLPSLAMASLHVSCQQDPPTQDSTETVKHEVTKVSGSGLKGVVEVVFKITEEGKAQVVDIQSTTPILREYILEKLKKIKLTDHAAKPGQTIRYRFVFQDQV